MKRFTDTGKWEDDWYMELSPIAKLLWQYILDKCDNAGVIKMNFALIKMQIYGSKWEKTVKWERFLNELGDRIEVKDDGKLICVCRFIEYQYGDVTRSNSKPVAGMRDRLLVKWVDIFDCLSKYKQWVSETAKGYSKGIERVPEGYRKGIHTLQEEEEEEEEEYKSNKRGECERGLEAPDKTIKPSGVIPKGALRRPISEQKKTKVTHNTETMIRIGKWFGRQDKTLWNVREADSLAKINPPTEEIDLLEALYTGQGYTEDCQRYNRNNLETLLNNWSTEMDRARNPRNQTAAHATPASLPSAIPGPPDDWRTALASLPDDYEKSPIPPQRLAELDWEDVPKPYREAVLAAHDTPQPQTV